MADFPTFYWEFNSHMALIKVNKKVYSLFPPNQLDWFYTLTMIGHDLWNVSGIKDDHLWGEEKININYRFDGMRWIPEDPEPLVPQTPSQTE
jgi:hypothetical protein